jgi:hypothetical protein
MRCIRLVKMVIPANTILCTNVPKYHILKVEPHLIIIFHPNQLVNALYLTDSDTVCTKIVQVDINFKKVCPAMIVPDIKWDPKLTKRALKRPHSPLGRLAVRS